MSEHRPTPELLEQLVALAQLACLYFDPSADEWVASPALCTAISHPPGWIGMSASRFQEKVHPDDVAIWQSAAHGQSGGAMRLKHQDGQWQWFKVRCDGTCPTLLIFTDISEARQMEAAVLDSQMRLHSVYNSAPVAIILWSKEGRITDWNRTAELMLGHTQEQVVYSKLVPTLISSADYALFSQNINQLMQTQVSTPVICRTLTRSGQELHCEWRNVVLRNVRGGLVGLMSLVNDVSTQLAAEAALRQSVAVAEELSRSKTQFIALASHELRTPLNGVIGMAQILESSTLPEEDHIFVQELLTSSKQMQQIIDGIMAFATADTLSDPLKPEHFALVELVTPLCETAERSAQSRGLEFVCQMDEPTSGLMCYNDLKKLSKILAALLDNALKFTENGRITLHVAGQPRHLRFEVQDTGIGIPAEYMEHLYTPFKQAEAHTVRRQGGLGIGLPTAKKLTDVLNGRLEIHSQVGSGTSVILEVDCIEPA